MTTRRITEIIKYHYFSEIGLETRGSFSTLFFSFVMLMSALELTKKWKKKTKFWVNSQMRKKLAGISTKLVLYLNITSL